VNAEVFTPAFGMGVQIGFTDDGRLLTRFRVGQGAQVSLSIVTVSLPSELDSRLSGSFVAGGPYGEAGASFVVPMTPLAFELNLISGEAGLALPEVDRFHRSATAAVPFADVSGPSLSGTSIGGFSLGGSYGGELIFVGRRRY
jgi:hypothetical protein